MTGSVPPARQPAFHLFLSPHLDDAVLSCGGQIHHLVAGGQPVAVCTLMAGEPPHDLPDTPILHDLHVRWGAAGDPVAVRRQEDLRALRRLGVIARHGTIPDCVYRVTCGKGGKRLALYPTEESLWGPVQINDSARLLLEAAPLPDDRTSVLHVPLGAGGHVDHTLVRDWGRRLSRAHSHLTVLYYEEYPYNRDPSAIQVALADFAPHTLTPALHPLSEADLQAKIDAIAAYESQISTFWKDVQAMARAVRDDAGQVGSGQPAEREWRVQADPQPDQE
jgi:LmbE family N-acetylglucosaminyl deacetylase